MLRAERFSWVGLKSFEMWWPGTELVSATHPNSNPGNWDSPQSAVLRSMSISKVSPNDG